MEPEALDRHLGCLLGLATGVALVIALVFGSPSTFEPIGERGEHFRETGGPFAGLLIGAFEGRSEEELVAPRVLAVEELFEDEPLDHRVEEWWRVPSGRRSRRRSRG